MTTTRLVITSGIVSLLAACAEEPPPRSVDEFLENSILLEATMVRCSENRSRNKYEAECVNAREAVNRIGAEEERARRAATEAQFERKRKSLRRTQEAAAEARRRAADARRRREEAEYLGVYDEVSPDTDSGSTSPPEAATESTATDQDALSESPRPEAEVAHDLEAVREELQRRQDSD